MAAMPRRLIVAVALVALVSATAYSQTTQLVRTTSGAYTGRSAHCGEIAGGTREIAQNVALMCEALPDRIFSGAYAIETLLFLKVSQNMAGIMLRSDLQTERLMLLWMKEWKRITGSAVVTITVEWGDVMIVEGQTTVFRGDVITFRGQ